MMHAAPLLSWRMDTGDGPAPAGAVALSERPLSARSVVASVLLGTDPPVMAASTLVRAGELFDLAEGTIRTALSRMASAGELRRVEDGRYELVGHLAQRRERQLASRHAAVRDWSGSWEMWVVGAQARPAGQRAELRRAARSLRLAELRDGVWLRPDNLSSGGPADEAARDAVVAQASHFWVRPDDEVELVRALWDIGGWNDGALELRRRMHQIRERLGDDDLGALQPGFLLSASVLRHLNEDPLLPAELRLAVAPSRDQTYALRRDYDTYDHSYRQLLRRWLSAG